MKDTYNGILSYRQQNRSDDHILNYQIIQNIKLGIGSRHQQDIIQLAMSDGRRIIIIWWWWSVSSYDQAYLQRFIGLRNQCAGDSSNDQTCFWTIMPTTSGYYLSTIRWNCGGPLCLDTLHIRIYTRALSTATIILPLFS